MERTTDKELAGHVKDGMMSGNNLLSCLVGCGQLVLKRVDKKDRNEAVDFPETGYKWNELGKPAQKFYTNHETDRFVDLQMQPEQTVSKILEVIEARPNEALYKMHWYEKWIPGRMIQFNTASPYANARGGSEKKQYNL